MVPSSSRIVLVLEVVEVILDAEVDMEAPGPMSGWKPDGRFILFL
jgi:hypothetical protein